MADSYKFRCSYPSCGYGVTLWVGPYWREIIENEELANSIKNGETDAPEIIKSLLQAGKRIQTVGNYLCPTCRVWKTERWKYILDAVYDEVHEMILSYQIYYLNRKPRCKICKSELVPIVNEPSPENKCPKCGQDHMRICAHTYID